MRRLANWLTNMILGLLLLLAVALVLLPAVFSSSLAVVYSGSMDPAMPVGAVAYMEPVDPAEIQVGDIIAFTQPEITSNITVSHRVTEIVDSDNLSFQTKGDANEDPDWFILPAENVLAKVSFSIPHLGRVLLNIKPYTKSRLGFGLFIGLPTFLLIGSAIRDMNAALNLRKQRELQRKKMMERRKKRSIHW